MERLRASATVALDMDGTTSAWACRSFRHAGFPARTPRAGHRLASFLMNWHRRIHHSTSSRCWASRPPRATKMYTTALATIDYIKAHYPRPAARRLFLLGTPSMISEVVGLNLAPTRRTTCRRVVAAFDMTLSYDCRAAVRGLRVKQGVPYIARPGAPPTDRCAHRPLIALVDCGSICISTPSGRRQPSAVLTQHARHPRTARIAVAVEIAMVGDRILHRRADGLQRRSNGCCPLGRNDVRRGGQGRPAAHIMS